MRILIISVVFDVMLVLSAFLINYCIKYYSREYIYSRIAKLPSAYTVLIPGALVYPTGELSPVLKDRVKTALMLYKKGKAKRFLLSGDHGRNNYDEVNAMLKYLVKEGVPYSDIFTDHAGFNTYNSMVRAGKVFMVRDVIIVTQDFHLSRSVYIARKKGLTAYGFKADLRIYEHIREYEIREFFARIKAFLNVFFNVSPKYLGVPVPITGDANKSRG
jgi:SanA protein